MRRRRHRGRRGGARQQRKRQRSALLSDRQTASASEAETGAAPHPSRRNERARAPPRIEQLPGTPISPRADGRQISDGDQDFLAMGRQDDNTTGFRVRTGCRARPVDEHDVHRRTPQSLALLGYGKAVNKSIPRSLRCVKGWRKLSPSFSRRPMTLPVRCAMAVEMTSWIPVRTQRRGLYFGGKDVSLPTDTGLVSSQPLAEISSSLKSPASTFDTWTFVRDRLRNHDIAGLFCTGPA